MANQIGEATASLTKAVEAGGEAARALLRTDNRFGPFRESPQFQSLIRPAAPLDLKDMR